MDKDLMCNLVTRMQQGDPDAATDLYLQSRDDLYYYIMKTVNDPHLAEDLLQDSFMEILETIHKLKEPAAYVTWSRQIAYHRCTAYFRKRHELLADENEDGQTVFDTVQEDREEFIPDAALEKEDLKATINQMLQDLPEEQRSALLLRYFDELSVADIAKIQGVSEGTVKSRLNYGRKAIKSSVEGYEKKNGVKLHSVAILPLLLWFFREKAVSAGTSLTAKGAAAVATAAVDGAKVAAGAEAVRTAAAATTKQVAAEGAKTAAKTAAKGAATRFVASLAATAVISSAGTAMVMKNVDDTPAPTTPPSSYVEMEQAGTTEPVPEATEPVDPYALPVVGSTWAGYGSSGSYSHWFDMALTEISDTAIAGKLTITKGRDTYHETTFTGTHTETADNKSTYHITLAEPHVLSTLWDVSVEELDLVYDRQAKTFIIERSYNVVMFSSTYWKSTEQALPTGTWSGNGSDDCYYNSNDEHLFTLRVDEMSTLAISGNLTVSYQGLVDHDTAFTGRARPRGSSGVIVFDLVFDNIRTGHNILDVIIDGITVEYDPATGEIAFSGLQYYEGTMTKQ